MEGIFHEFVLVECVNVVILISDNVSNYPNRVFLDFLVLRVEGLDNAVHDCLISHKGENGLISLRVGEFIECLEDDLMLCLNVSEEGLERDLLLVDVVDEYPELLGVLFDEAKDVSLFADDLVACSDNCHLANID
jgi:hypothetical protein